MNYRVPFASPFMRPDPVDKLEHCLRVCYKSEDKINPESMGKLIRSCIKRGHRSFLEHYRIRVACSPSVAAMVNGWQLTQENKFIDVKAEDSVIFNHCLYGNLRAFLDLADQNKKSVLGSIIYNMLNVNLGDIFEEQDWIMEDAESILRFEEVQYLGEACDYLTFHIETDRAILSEWTRHRSLSPTVESTRYVKYENDGINITLPMPFLWAPSPDQEHLDMWVMDVVETMLTNSEFKFVTPEGNITHAGVTEIARLAKIQATWEMACLNAETAYRQMREFGATPQEARSVLPNSTKAEFYMTGTISAWEKFLALRATKEAQPQIKLLADRINEYVESTKEELEDGIDETVPW